MLFVSRSVNPSTVMIDLRLPETTAILLLVIIDYLFGQVGSVTDEQTRHEHVLLLRRRKRHQYLFEVGKTKLQAAAAAEIGVSLINIRKLHTCRPTEKEYRTQQRNLDVNQAFAR